VIPQHLIGFDLSLESFKRALPAVTFFAGFLWDALTLGRSVGPLGLVLLTGYLAADAAVVDRHI
jgi:hypothetical protein